MHTKSGAAKPVQNPSAKQLQSISWEQHLAGAVLGAPSITTSITGGQEITLHLNPICSSRCISALQTRWSHLLFLVPLLP